MWVLGIGFCLVDGKWEERMGKLSFWFHELWCFVWCLSLSLSGICLLILGSCQSFGHWDSVWFMGKQRKVWGNWLNSGIREESLNFMFQVALLCKIEYPLVSTRCSWVWLSWVWLNWVGMFKPSIFQRLTGAWMIQLSSSHLDI